MVGLLAIECEELSIYTFFLEGPLYVSQKTKDNRLVPNMFFWRILFLSSNLANFAKEFFLDLTKINK